jgi:predicted nucleic acid-binding protein
MTPASALPAALVDWSAYVRVTLAHRRPDTGRRLEPAILGLFLEAVRNDSIYASAPFRIEALRSAQSAAEFALLSGYLDSLRQTKGDADTWTLAERTQRELAENPAVSHRVSFPDLLLASIASQHSLGVLHYDSDYDLLASHTSLEFESAWIAPAGSVD